MVLIENWLGGVLNAVGNFGMHDYVLGIDNVGLIPEDEATAVLDSGLRPSVDGDSEPQPFSPADEKQVSLNLADVIQPSDHVYRYTPSSGVFRGREVFVLRRSLFSEYCSGSGGPTRFPISDTMARAVAFFGARFGLDRTGDRWCQQRLEEPGVLDTPINPSEAGINDLETVLGLIREARMGRFAPPTHLVGGEERELWLQQARQVALGVTDQDVQSLQGEIDRQKPNHTILGWIHENPLGSLGIAVFGFHYGQKLLSAIDGRVFLPLARRVASRLGWAGKPLSIALIVGGSFLTHEEEARAATSSPSRTERVLSEILVDLLSAPFGGVSDTIVSEQEEQKMLEEERRAAAARRY